MAETKKLLVPFDPQKPSWNPNDWLLPIVDDNNVSLTSLNTSKVYQLGRVVFVGSPITENDLFTRLVDSGRKVPDVGQMLEALGQFVNAMDTVKIGNIVEAVGRSGSTLALVVVSTTPTGFGK